MTKTFYKWKPTILDESRFGSKFDNVNWDHSEISRLILSKSMQINYLLFIQKSSENVWFSSYLRGSGS